MIGIIVSGHGNYATGISSSVKLIAGLPEHYEMVDFVQEDSVEDLERKLNEALDRLSDCSGILCFTDLLGGSPFKTAVEVSFKRTEKPMVVLAGTNLGMIIECSMARNFVDDVQMLADMGVNTGKDQVYKYVFTVKEETEDAEDFI